MVVVGIWTLSFKKVLVTYVLGVLGIAGVLLPDWDYFDRDYSRWFSFVSEQDRLALAQRSGFSHLNMVEQSMYHDGLDTGYKDDALDFSSQIGCLHRRLWLCFVQVVAVHIRVKGFG
ncbi:hypothetical protein POTOM_007876 [Populus tomentosa]|uniref:Uncharacterized protein n=1 Tax=Populus tomentosa TaxID=118781 RepID=A0A8X8ABG0_POPTO|nr:hypothetical protein POTOM_007876 [Populus tomentosa]